MRWKFGHENYNSCDMFSMNFSLFWRFFPSYFSHIFLILYCVILSSYSSSIVPRGMSFLVRLLQLLPRGHLSKRGFDHAFFPRVGLTITGMIFRFWGSIFLSFFNFSYFLAQLPFWSRQYLLASLYFSSHLRWKLG